MNDENIGLSIRLLILRKKGVLALMHEIYMDIYITGWPVFRVTEIARGVGVQDIEFCDREHGEGLVCPSEKGLGLDNDRD